MSASVGFIFIGKNTATITVGDGNKLSPRSLASLYTGAGFSDNGDLQHIFNNGSNTVVSDNDLVDQEAFLNL